ncbi:hypothetical protein KIM372_10190 [Bombiscardovia nodaiensis]|uniref:Uncharacterized protein n=1 Tax=Bombiscardovia nodaiensis TaxID=2932181 RepID=A0ABM8B8H0_9BIFI|nr:hypothetical protein KIM372_10190 [Bombiscardovia nodaiensis]
MDGILDLAMPFFLILLYALEWAFGYWHRPVLGCTIPALWIVIAIAALCFSDEKLKYLGVFIIFFIMLLLLFLDGWNRSAERVKTRADLFPALSLPEPTTPSSPNKDQPDKFKTGPSNGSID